MAPEKTSPSMTGTRQESVFRRLLNLPAINSTCEMIERTYSSTKQSNPLICSVCVVYERGALAAGNLAIWSTQPAIHMLEPQITAANSMACRGLDHLEQRIPALHFSPEELAVSFIAVASSTVQTAKEGFSGPVISTSDRVMNLASESFQLTRAALSNGLQYVLNSRPALIVGEGTDAALTMAERFVNYVLPPGEVNEEDVPGDKGTVVNPPGHQQTYRRLEALTRKVYRRAYDQTSIQIQRTKSKGQDLVTRFPGVSPLNVELVSGLGPQLVKAYASVVSEAKRAPLTTIGLAKDGAATIQESLGAATELVRKNLSSWGLFSQSSTAEPEKSESCNMNGAGQKQDPDQTTQSPSENGDVDGDPQQKVVQQVLDLQKVAA
ncbi:perilipin-1 isoform X1 [Denticeps clupeoides]|uniref:perilipin-1 isoform X1 n=1 Tax=Denticeps clupeoides TaxID=299321 RepID=UPI0010A35374|nr:perilipin-1 isoform X1 [Denticeps clupeoides]